MEFISIRVTAPRQPKAARLITVPHNFAAVPQFFYTYTAKDAPLSFGLGVYAPFGGNMGWPQDTAFRAVATSGSLKYITINPVVAVKLLPSLSIGGGVMVNYGKIGMEQGLQSFPNTAQLFQFSRATVGAWVTMLVMLWQPHEKISIRRHRSAVRRLSP